MYQVGEYVVCGNKGPCVVDSIGPLDFNGAGNMKEYYTLVPLYSAGSKVFVPVENESSKMRYILSKKEAQELLNSMASIEPLWITEEKKREQIYKENVNDGDCTHLVQTIKTLYFRIQQRIDDGKKVTAVDEKYFHIAEDRLFAELSVALDVERDQIKGYVSDYMKM